MGQLAENLLGLPLEINLLELHDHLLLAVEGAKRVTFGFAVGTGEAQLLDDLGHVLIAELAQHAVKANERVEIIPLKAVELVLGDDRLDLAGHAIESGPDTFLLQFLPQQLVAAVGAHLGRRGGGKGERQQSRAGEENSVNLHI